ncbi:hypothetical protein ACIGO9_31710 [Nocardia asteroides]|uniref:hypothetical protein n=1 Tax=Nocardia asteroides TaxID=1824 RepID=UPI0037C55986
MQVETIDDGARLAVHSPYNADYIDCARELGGRWNPDAEAWVYDARDRDRVEELLRAIYGTDGRTITADDLVTVRVPLAMHEEARTGRAVFAGRKIAERPARDSRVRLSDGVVLVAGKLDSSGGSMPYPAIDAAPDVFVEIRELPRAALDVERPSSYTIVEVTAQVDRAGLAAERERLLARLAEIDTQLAQLTTEN